MAFEDTALLFLGAGIITLLVGYAVAELANMFVTARAINSVANTASQGINALLAVHNVSTISTAAQGSPAATATATADTKQASATT